MIRVFPLLLTAALTTASFPPYDRGYLAFVALVPLLLATGGESGRRDFFRGWLTGWIASTAVVWWVINTITHYGGISWPLAVPILLLLTGCMGLFWALFAWARGRLLRRWPGSPDWLISPVLWVALEYARAHLPEVAFPWALLGYTQYLNLRLIQIADLFGVWAVSFLVVAVNAAVAALLSERGAAGDRSEASARIVPLAAAAVLAVAAWWYGGDRLGTPERDAGLRVGVVQGNIEQDVKWDPAFKKGTFELYAALSREVGGEGVDLVVWPETAAPFFYQFEPRFQEMISDLAREIGAPILFGAPGREGEGRKATAKNRAYLVGSDGRLLGKYDKVRLVPFGEFVPWHDILFFVEKMVDMVGEFSPGEGPVVMRIGGGRFGTLICYEVIFPDLVRRSVLGGAEFLVNITNDAWFGRTAASRQHFSTLVFRAVENRRSLARAANTGISGFVDWRGRILASSDLFVRRHFSAVIPVNGELSWYSRWGDLLPQGCSLAALLAVAAALLTRKRRKYDL